MHKAEANFRGIKPKEIKACGVPSCGESGSVFQIISKCSAGLIRDFEKATGVSLRLRDPVEGFDLPEIREEACRLALESSVTAVECLRFHRGLYRKVKYREQLVCGECVHGLFNGLFPVCCGGQVVAIMEMGPFRKKDEAWRRSLFTAFNDLMNRIKTEARNALRIAGEALPPEIRAVMDHVARNLDREISLGDGARILGFEKKRFSRLFHRHTGMFFPSYIAGLRVELAYQYLTNSKNASISEIAMKCGFGSSTQFNRLFQRLTGISPGRYRALDAMRRQGK